MTAGSGCEVAYRTRRGGVSVSVDQRVVDGIEVQRVTAEALEPPSTACAGASRSSGSATSYVDSDLGSSVLVEVAAVPAARRAPPPSARCSPPCPAAWCDSRPSAGADVRRRRHPRRARGDEDGARDPRAPTTARSARSASPSASRSTPARSSSWSRRPRRDRGRALRASTTRVAWVTIDRPEARNALNAEVASRPVRGHARFNVDDDAAVLVLTGDGDKAFCAGGDLKEMAETRPRGAAAGLRPPSSAATSRSRSRRSPRSTASPTPAGSCSPRCATCASPPITRASPSPRPRWAGAHRGPRRCPGSFRRASRWSSS